MDGDWVGRRWDFGSAAAWTWVGRGPVLGRAIEGSVPALAGGLRRTAATEVGAQAPPAAAALQQHQGRRPAPGAGCSDRCHCARAAQAAGRPLPGPGRERGRPRLPPGQGLSAAWAQGAVWGWMRDWAPQKPLIGTIGRAHLLTTPSSGTLGRVGAWWAARQGCWSIARGPRGGLLTQKGRGTSWLGARCVLQRPIGR